MATSSRDLTIKLVCDLFMESELMPPYDGHGRPDKIKARCAWRPCWAWPRVGDQSSEEDLCGPVRQLQRSRQAQAAFQNTHSESLKLSLFSAGLE